MHTKSLAVLKRQVRLQNLEGELLKVIRWAASRFLYDLFDHLQLIRRKMVESAKESIKQKASNSEIYGKMQDVFIEMDSSPIVSSLISTNLSIVLKITL